jgi:hypothetical protein
MSGGGLCLTGKEMSMARYFFDLIDSHGKKADFKGSTYFDRKAAVQAAEMAARDFMVEKLLKDEDPDGRRFDITDEHGNYISTVRFRDLLPPGGV